MAGERLGITYEAVVAHCLGVLHDRKKTTGAIHWGARPAGMSIDTDFIIGDVNAPDALVLVTHSGSEKESNRKFWRNVGEVAEAKTRLATVPRVVSVLFDDTIKPDIKLLGQSTFDSQLAVGDRTYGRKLIEWVRTIEKALPADREEKLATISEWVNNKSRQAAPVLDHLRTLTSDLEGALRKLPSPLDALWAKSRLLAGKARIAKTTSLRRGLGKLVLLPSAMDATAWPRVKLSEADAAVALSLGFASPSIKGPTISDPDILWTLGALSRDEAKAILDEQPLDRMAVWMEPLLELPRLEQQVTWIEENWSSLRDPAGLFAALTRCASNPSSLGPSVPSGTRRVWLFHALVDVLKALSDRQQGFGLSVLLADIAALQGDTRHRKTVSALAARAGVRNVKWRDDRGVSLGLGDWSNGPSAQGFPLYPDDLARIADALARRLASYPNGALDAVKASMRDVVVATNLEARLISYRLFDPLGALTRVWLKEAGRRVTECPVEPACFSQYARSAFGADLDPRSGGTSLIRCQQTLINWQSCTDSGRDHKKKELCGRAVAVRNSWDASAKRFVARPDVKRMLLLLDGTWRDDDLSALAKAGWDEIFYPDEMDKLVKAIV